MKGKNFWKHLPKKENFSKLFNDDDKGQMLYMRDSVFRDFVDNWDKGNTNLWGWSFGDFYKAYMGRQLSLF